MTKKSTFDASIILIGSCDVVEIFKTTIRYHRIQTGTRDRTIIVKPIMNVKVAWIFLESK